MSKNNFPNLQILLNLVFKVSLSNLPMILVLALLLKMLLAFFFFSVAILFGSQVGVSIRISVSGSYRVKVGVFD